MLFLGAHTTGSLAAHVKGHTCILFVQERCSAAIKIEGTRKPSERLLAIDENNSADTFLFGLVRLPDGDDPKLAEAELHARFAASRIRGRWFRATGDLTAYVQQHGQAAIRELLGALRPHSQPTGIVTIDEIAAHLGVSVKTVRRMVKAGKIPVMRAGAKLRFLPEDVVASIQSEP